MTKMQKKSKKVKKKLSFQYVTTKKQMIQKISHDENFVLKEVRLVVQAFIDNMINSLQKGERVEFRDFGIFEVVVRKQKIGRNPKKASESIVIPEHKVVKFTASKKMSDLIEIAQPLE